MRLPLLLLMPTALTYLADCSARSTNTTLKQRLRQSVALFDAIDEGNIEGHKFQRMLKAKSAEKEEDDEDPKDERGGVLPGGEISALNQGEGTLHAAETNAANDAAIAKWFALADEKAIIKDGIDEVMKLTFVKRNSEDLQRTPGELFKKWSTAKIEPQPLFAE